MISESLIVLILAAINFTHILDFVIMMPLGPQLMTGFGISAQEFSVVVASYTFSAGASGLLGAFFIDRFDRKFSLNICYAGFIAGTVACAVAPSFQFLVLARILAGVFGGLGFAHDSVQRSFTLSKSLASFCFYFLLNALGL